MVTAARARSTARAAADAVGGHRGRAARRGTQRRSLAWLPGARSRSARWRARRRSCCWRSCCPRRAPALAAAPSRPSRRPSRRLAERPPIRCSPRPRPSSRRPPPPTSDRSRSCATCWRARRRAGARGACALRRAAGAPGRGDRALARAGAPHPRRQRRQRAAVRRVPAEDRVPGRGRSPRRRGGRRGNAVSARLSIRLAREAAACALLIVTASAHALAGGRGRRRR